MDFPGIGFGICIDVWMSVSAASFEALDGSAPGPPLEGCFGYLGNEIPGFPGSRDLPADLWFRSGEAVVVLHNADHALVRAQRDGISLDAVIFLAEFLHD